MRKEVTYYAEDNTPFKSESECKKYEEKKKENTSRQYRPPCVN